MSKYINVAKGIMNRHKIQDNAEQNCHSECLVEHYVRRCLDYLGQRYGITKTRIVLGGIKQTKEIVNLISVV